MGDWVKAIEAEYRDLMDSEETIHNKVLHSTILATWERDSPKMYRTLKAANLADKLAAVLQDRMWRRQNELMDAGYPVTDAREQAEREILMLEPEDDLPEQRELPIRA